MTGLVLSIFPGIGILDRGFEEEGFCIVRGPDLLWGGDIKRFHPPSGVFDGVIGGPPCQAHSSLVPLLRHQGKDLAEDLIPEFIRIVEETRPRWWVMENIITAPIPEVAGYLVDPAILNNRWIGGRQSRRHRFTFGTKGGRRLIWSELVALDNPDWSPRVMASGQIGNIHGHGRRNMRKVRRGRKYLGEMLALQGLPEDFFKHSPFTVVARHKAIGNAVALPMARVLARAVREAISTSDATIAGDLSDPAIAPSDRVGCVVLRQEEDSTDRPGAQA